MVDKKLLREKFTELYEFIDLTSDAAIREAAYPIDEWKGNGGNTGSGMLAGFNNYTMVKMQDDPPEITRLGNGLLNPFNENKPNPVKQELDKRAANIAEHWEKVQCHAYFKNLNKDVNFTSAWSKFQKKTKLESASRGYKSEFAKFRFYNLIAQHIGFQQICDEVGYKHTYPKKKVLGEAEGHIKRLQADFKNGLKLNEFNAQFQLESYLKQLVLQINQAPRKAKETPTAAKRRSLEGLSVACINVFDEASSTILSNLAGVLGWVDCHTSTISEIVSFAKEKVQLERNNALAEAVKTHTL